MSIVQNITLNPDLKLNPLLSQWISLDSDAMILLRAGKVELGQGIGIVQLQIAAEELDVPITAIRLVAGHTGLSVDQGYTSGSNSVQVGAMALRQICAEVRHAFIHCAARQLDVSVESITIDRGVFSAAGATSTLTYADLAPHVDLNVPATGLIQAKKIAQHTIVGKSIQRPDLEKKLFGAGFIHDLEIDGMLHGRIVRPPSYAAELIDFDEQARQTILSMPGVHTLLVTGRLIGVCAIREEQAVAAAAAMHALVQWNEPTCLPVEQQAQSWLRSLPSETSVVSCSLPTAHEIAHGTEHETAHEGQHATPKTGQSIHVNYSKPFIAHASIGPSCALAQWTGEQLTVWTHGQGSFPMQRELANLFAIPASNITVIHADGAGCYGHNGSDDAAFDVAMLAREAGCAVRLQWSREDEFSWSPHGSAMSISIDASIDHAGKIVQWNHQTWSHTHVQRPGMAKGLNSLAALHRDPPAPIPPATDFPLSMGGGGQRNALPLYDLPQHTIQYHLVTESTIRSSALRGLGAYANIFAIESCMDELAILAQQDPIAFRLNHLNDARARAVLENVAAQSAWYQPLASAVGADAIRGRGIGFARYKNSGAYCAVVVEIEVTDRIVLDKVWVTVDAGEIIHPDGLINQIEGGVLQAASWTLKESLHWDQTHITTRGWDDYPILRFDETPQLLDVSCMDQPNAPALGTGECAAGPTAAAIANALHHAIGIRMRDLPLTPERLAQSALEV